MAFEIPGFSFSLEAAADLSVTGQFLALVADGSGNAALAGAAATIIGVLQNDPVLGQAAAIMNKGVTKMEAGAAIAAGAGIETNASAQAITLVVGDRVGTALQAASGAGEIISVLLA
jgi:hypothetical protein